MAGCEDILFKGISSCKIVGILGFSAPWVTVVEEADNKVHF